MRRKRRQFSAELKTKAVLELLSDEMTVAQIASKYEITAKSLSDWKKQFLEIFLLRSFRHFTFGHSAVFHKTVRIKNGWVSEWVRRGQITQ